MSILLLLSNVGLAEILINEVLYNPDGTDGPLEWIEICNNGADDVDVLNFEIQVAGTSWSESYTFTTSTIVPAGGHYVFGPGVDASSDFSPDLPNGGNPTDGIRLLQGDGTVLDTVLYGGPNDNGLEDDQGSVAGPFSDGAGSGMTMARHTDCTDVANNGTDFVETSTLTPGSANITPVVEICENTIFDGVVINEVLYNPSGSDSGHEWIEIMNTTDEDIDVSGWSIEAGTSSFSNKGSFGAGTILPAHGYLLVGEAEAYLDLGQAPDVVFSLGMGNGGSSIDGLRLVDCNDVVLDTVLYGDSATIGDWEDDNGPSPSSFAPEAGDGEAIGRMPNGVDSNQSGDDFQILGFPTPWSSNDAVPTCDGQYDIKINEFIPNPIAEIPDGETEATKDGREWVELYNKSSSEIDLTGWKLQWGGTGSFSGGEIMMPMGTMIPANGYLLVGGEYVENADVVTPLSNDLDMTLASSNADVLRLLHCGPGVADTVVYGPSEDGVADNPDELLDDSGLIATSAAPKPTEGFSLARLQDGVDSDQSGLDFVVSAVNSPGEANPVIVCGEGGFNIKINEIFPNPNGSDSGQEWVELYNAGTEIVRLDGWRIETASSSWSEKVVLPAETEIAPGEFFLIGESEVPSDYADYTLDSNLSLGNASTGFDGVRLLNCLGAIEDTLLYGKSSAEPSADEEVSIDDAGNHSFAIFPDSGKAIGRYPDGVDSDDNGVDFQTNMLATPGASNEGTTGEEDTGKNTNTPVGRGCSKEPSATDEPSKCSYVSDLSMMMWFSSLFVLFRRRE